MTRLHLAICSHLWTSSYYQKQQHFRSCATSALILCSFLHVGATSQRAPCISCRLRAGVSGLHGALALGPLPQAELRAPMAAPPPPSAASEQVADWKARLFLHGLDRSVHHVVLSNRTCWPSGGSPVPFGGSHLRSCFWMSPCVQTALSPSSCQTPDSILFPGAGAVMADESSWRR